MEVQTCGIHSYHEVLGIDTDRVRFYWTLYSHHRDARQVAYRIIVALRSFVVEQDEPEHADILWDSGRVESNAQRNILCAPDSGFHSASFHYWCVTIWDQDGVESRGSIQEFFTAYPRSTALLPPYSMNQTYMPHNSLIFRTWFEDAPNRWKGVWIGDNGDKPFYVRREIQLARKPRRAIVFASGLGHFNFVCNGDDRATDGHVLDPGWTNYHRKVQFVAYDVSNILTEGLNVLGAHVGNGFYTGDDGSAEGRFFWPKYEDNTYVRYGNELCFFAELHMFYDDGTRECVTSDQEWMLRKSATTLANVYMSETKDLRRYPWGWDKPGFVYNSEWQQAIPVTGPRGKLKYQSQPPIKLHEIVHPVSSRTLEAGKVTFDLGQNMTTMVKLNLSGATGSEVVVRFSESIDNEGYVLMPDPLFKQFETGVFCKIILSGDGEEVWQPDFSMTSARYIQVEGVSMEPSNALPVIHSLVGQHVSSAADRLGSFTTDKDDVNKLLNMCYWSFVSNLFSYHTDCPQIEKFGWLEVTHLLFPATQYIRDIEALHTKILDDIIDAQEPDGLVPTMAPEMRYMCGPLHDTISWGGAIALIPDLISWYYDSTTVFERLYMPCVHYMEYLKTKERENGLIEHGLGDWGRDIAFGNNQANIETAVYYKCLRNVERMARELGRESDEARFGRWADRIYRVYNEKLLVTGKKLYPYVFYTSRDNLEKVDRNMVAQAVALQFGLVPVVHIVDVQRAFLEDCALAGNRIQAGEIGLRYLFNTLSDLDRPDIVLEMARQKEHPSYMRFVRRGETTLNEFWQDSCRSKCHDMLGTIYEWLYEYVFGVKALAPAYRRWRLKPPIRSEFASVRGCFQCPYGLIKVLYERSGQQAKVAVTVPTSTTATLILPAHTNVVELWRLCYDRRETQPTEEKDSIELQQGSYEITIAL